MGSFIVVMSIMAFILFVLLVAYGAIALFVPHRMWGFYKSMMRIRGLEVKKTREWLLGMRITGAIVLFAAAFLLAFVIVRPLIMPKF